MHQLRIFNIVLNSAKGFLCFLLTGFKISACRLEQRNNRATGKAEQRYYFHR